jgi:hypothetical protein
MTVDLTLLAQLEMRYRYGRSDHSTLDHTEKHLPAALQPHACCQPSSPTRKRSRTTKNGSICGICG